MKKKFNYGYSLPPWLKTCRDICKQFIIPFTIFQGIRTFFIPTTFDVLLLAVFLLLAFAYHAEWI
ncbi:hypothetical protein [Rossellomorea sp. BNER]|uniref:hypothetical protein n=1 Tax=Rossellomorea sp. BNER TaxID=2962031 RepID=UPI003AF21E69|nr:hypothetical protein [Rossellomorea sp. BNER]